MNYGLRYWLMILAFLLGFFHGPRAARGHDLPYSIVGRNGDTVWLGGEYAFHIHPSLTTEDVRRMIDSAKTDWDKPLYPPCPDGLLGCLVLHYPRPDSCMVIDTTWHKVEFRERWVRMPWMIDTTWGPCDD